MMRFFKVIIVIVCIVLWFKANYVSYFTSNKILKKVFQENEIIKNIRFNKITDLLVFLHIPKTGGTDFENKIIFNLKELNIRDGRKSYENVCEPRPEVEFYYNCLRDKRSSSNLRSIEANWIFTRRTVGW
jgi:hypothetical protein